MMTKEEVAQVIAYCDENKISYKQRLSELGISPWNFYDAKRKYAPKEEGENAGEFHLENHIFYVSIFFRVYYSVIPIFNIGAVKITELYWRN